MWFKKGGREERRGKRRKKVNCMWISDLGLGRRPIQCTGLPLFLPQGACDGGEACDGEGGEGCPSGAGGGGATTGVNHPGGGEGGEHCESAGE